MTLNEPFVSAFVGYHEGRHAPGHTDVDEALAAAHHLLLAHGWAVPLIRRNAPGAQVGIVVNVSGMMPASASAADCAAAWLEDGKLNRWFLDPLAARGYPADMVQHFGNPMDFVQPGDMAAVSTPLDFLGVNYYQRRVVRSTAIPESQNEPQTVFLNPHPTEMGWEVCPEAFHDMLCRLHFDYGFPQLYVTENGAAYRDEIGPGGKVDDPLRIAYLKGHLASAARAIAAGVPLRGYFVWSLLDNFEWAHGYSKRFGLVYVDYATQQRLPKASASWYRDVIEAHALEAPGEL
jgi:beta-glucosidase